MLSTITTTEDGLRTLGGVIDDDILISVPSAGGDGWVLDGFVQYFPNGVDMGRKLGLKVRELHKPVRAYKQKLGRNMERQLEGLSVGKFVRRETKGGHALHFDSCG